MKKYFIVSLVGILFLSACSLFKSADVETSAETSSSTEETSSNAPSKSDAPPSSVEVTTDLFQKAVAERDPEQCKKIQDKSQSKNCLEIVTTLKARDEAAAEAGN